MPRKNQKNADQRLYKAKNDLITNALEAQRRNQVISETEPVNSHSELNGFIYDPISQRYYKKERNSLELNFRPTTLQTNSFRTIDTNKLTRKNIIQLLEKRYNFERVSWRDRLCLEMTALQFTLSNPNNIQQGSKGLDVSHHPIFGDLICTSSTLFFNTSRKNIILFQLINDPSMTCIVRWSPSSTTPIFAFLFTIHNTSRLIIGKCQNNDFSGPLDMKYQEFRYNDLNMKSLEWSSCGVFIILCAESGEIVKQDLSVGALTRYNIYKSKGCPVSICNSKNNPFIKYCGLRNGAIIQVDERSPDRNNCTTRISKMKYCIDHLWCLHDGYSLIVQDVTDTIKLFDLRKSEYAPVLIRQPHSSTRSSVSYSAFWVSPCDNFIISAPKDSSLGIEVRSTRFSDNLIGSFKQGNVNISKIAKNWCGQDEIVCSKDGWWENVVAIGTGTSGDDNSFRFGCLDRLSKSFSQTMSP